MERGGAGRPGRSVPAWAVDAALGVLVVVTLSLAIGADIGGREDPDALAYLWAVGLGALMLVRRRYPVLVLAITVLGLFAYYAAGYPPVGLAVPVAAALFSAAERGRAAWAIGAALVATTVSLAFRLAEGQDLALVVGYELAGHVLLMAAAIAVGDGIRSRRELAAHAERDARLAAERSARDAEARERETRLALARDLHDSIGHGVSVVSIHADVAREAITRADDTAATSAVALIKEASATVMADLRRAVAALRGGSASGAPQPRAADLPALLAPIAGVSVTTDISLPAHLPPAVEETAFRVVQEAVTNIRRHSTAASAAIRIHHDAHALHVEVVDDGAPPARPREGHGLTGMRERVSALGGTLTAQAQPEGFAVTAVIPLGAPS